VGRKYRQNRVSSGSENRGAGGMERRKVMTGEFRERGRAE